ncbi:hypothetical protein NP493_253g00002 [Ridgeia piscesae]|uniref:Mitochondrial ornithine transporter 1 n=1 Tax=Ridgeia piscesae TaxID=27915 RepID=A0AAD9NYI7_RIDPI|nr:hypothetical protein NP493_253g00002 [Ridgeia piscesae]
MEVAEKKNHYVEAVVDFTAGVLGGATSVYIGQPLDTVKVKMQTFPTLYKNALQCFMSTVRQEGIAHGLYAGTVPSLMAQVSENAVLFMAYGVCQKLVTSVSGKTSVDSLSVVQNGLAGSCAAVFSSLVLCPTELVKCRMQAMREMALTGQLEDAMLRKSHLHHMSAWSLTRDILHEEGVVGLFRGLVPTFAREVPGYFFFFGGYEISRALLTPPGKSKDDLGPIQTMVCGGLGGVSLWLAIFPTDVIKSRVQVQVNSNKPRLSFIPMVLAIMREEGVRALYKGLGPTILRTFPATGGLFLAYETTKKVLLPS